jgi:hypothetical protein
VLLRSVVAVKVTFTKATHRKDFPIWVAQAGKRRIDGAGLGSDPRHLPHDVVTLVIEKELGITDGFFGTVAAGGTFRSMAKRKNKPGRAAIARNVPTLTAAEHIVNQTWSDWLAGRDTPCKSALDRAYLDWMSLPPGGQVTFEWLSTPAHPAAPKKKRRR